MTSNRFPSRLTGSYASTLLNNVDNFLFDCDGVIWNWPQPIQGSVDCINKLKEIGKKCFFITNNSTKTRQTLVEQFKSVGIKNVDENDIICTSWLLAGYLKSISFEDKVYVIGSQSIGHELDSAGIEHDGIGTMSIDVPDLSKFDCKDEIQLDSRVKCVAVGFDYHFSYAKMVLATTYASQEDCLFIGTNKDAIHPSGPHSNLVIPAEGTFINALRTSIGREPIVLGKPHKTTWDVLKATHNITEENSCMIGDRLDTDIAFGNTCGLKYTLAVLTGITSEAEILRNTENEDTQHYVPHFFTNSLGDLIEFF
jgi:phosphoglycolate/pyridoxal phosphate phosphatase family enzyme